jgi:hypothetical protein
MLIKLDTWPCLEIRLQEEARIYILIYTDINSFERAEEFRH